MSMKRKREDDDDEGKKDMVKKIVWQTPDNPPERHDYIFCNGGKRFVRPYYFEFICHVKSRWAGKTIVDLFAQEFKGRPYEYYVGAVQSGRIQVDGDMVPVSYIVKSSQKISHFVHRHEPPVMANHDVLILQKESDVVTICKPASIPVHPCGQYRKNTVVGILQAEHDLAPLFRILDMSIPAVHRLDRLVSGLLILARTAAKADLFRQQIEAGKVQKQYIAKVVGIFPEDEQVVDASIHYDAREGRSTAEVSCSSLSESSSTSKGKAACTKFTRIRTINGTHSIVLCQPITGRTHQIRVHLQYLGHPIANDMLYLSDCSEQQPLRSEAAQLLASRRTVNGVAVAVAEEVLASSSSTSSKPPSATSCTDDEIKIKEEEESRDQSAYNSDFDNDPVCTNCPDLAPKGYERGEEEGLWLHCIRYSGPEWTYDCPYPDWAVS